MADEPKVDNPIASMGGKARAAKMTPAERRDSAKKAAAARWGDKLPRAEYGSEDHPLCISGIEIPAYVLNDGRRVLVSTSMVGGLDMSLGTAGGGEGDRLARFMAGKTVNPFIPKELVERINNPIRFVNTRGAIVHGYEATVLADICEAVMAARSELRKSQQHIADRCELLIRGFARVGIVAMVDEVTGYQDARPRDALAKILEAFVAKEIRKWVRTFPPDYYEQLFRLKGLTYNGASKRPGVIGHLTNDLVYARLAPGVLDELRRKNPTVPEKGYRKVKHFQWLTSDHGHPRLRMHLEGVIVAMKLSRDWREFYARLNELYPKLNETPALPGMKYDATADATDEG